MNIIPRRFLNIEEIQDDPAFVSENPVTLENYAGLEGWYSFDKEELACCVKKAVGLCHQRHRKGWVARLKDNSKSVIGGHCAQRDFGAASIIGQDIARAQNAIDQAQALEDIRDYLSERNDKLAAINDALARANEVNRRIQGFLARAGAANARAIKDRARIGGPFSAIASTPPRYAPPDADGFREKIEDGRQFVVPVGVIPGIAAADPGRVSVLGRELNVQKRAYEGATLDMLLSKPATARKFRAVLGDHDRVMDLANDFLGQAEQFLTADLTPACYAVSDNRARRTMAELALERLGKKGVSASIWLNGLDENLRRLYRVQRIRPAG